MTGDTATENGADVHEDSGGAEERRPASLVKLQHMLKKVSHSPYQTLLSSTSDSSGSSANDCQQEGDPSAAATDSHQNGEQEVPPLSPQNGFGGGLARRNPFYTHYLESNGKSLVMEDVPSETNDVNLDSIFAPPPEFQSSPLDLGTEIKTVENGSKVTEPQTDLFPPLTSNRFQMSPRNSSPSAHFKDVTLNSPDLFKPAPPPKRSALLRDKGFGLLQAAKGEDVLHADRTREVNHFHKPPGTFVDPFKPQSNTDDDLFRSPKPVATNPFYTTTTGELPPAVQSGALFNTRGNRQDLAAKDDLFVSSSEKNLDVFSPASANSVDPFPSPITRDLFSDFSSTSDPFSTNPSTQYDPFQDVSNGASDIFQPLPSKAPGVLTSPSLSAPSETELPSHLFTAPSAESRPAVQLESSGPSDIILTTPQGTKHDILQPTPFTRARNLSMTPNQSPAQMTHVSTFKRPPKPLPRTRPPRKEKPPVPEKPPKPERPPPPEKPPVNPIGPEPAGPDTAPKPAFRPLPKPVLRLKPRTPETKPPESENLNVFQDILLLGQEKCVEDWPEDSPELDPDFRPSGTLRLRRESLNMKADSDGGSGEDQDGAKKKEKKFRMSLLPRRGSREKIPDEGKSRTLPGPRKLSKDYQPDFHSSPGENEDWEPNDYKKNHLKTKVSQLLRRASASSFVSERNHVNEPVGPDWKDDDVSKKGGGRKDSVRRWSEGTVVDASSGEEEEGGEAGGGGGESKKKRKVKIKFVPHRGFAITVQKPDPEPKGAHGYTPPRKGSKEKSLDDVWADGKTSQDEALEDVEALKAQSAAALTADAHFQKTSAGLNGEEDSWSAMEDCKPKKPSKMKPLHLSGRSWKEDVVDGPQKKKKSSFSAEDEDELNEDCRPKTSRHKGFIPTPSRSRSSTGPGPGRRSPQLACRDAFAEDDLAPAGKEFRSPGEAYDGELDEQEAYKPKKPSKLKVLKKRMMKRKDRAGAASGDFLSEAARAEWEAAQMDGQAMAALEGEGEDGDTDSLMEWWYTVEQWDEVPSDDEDKVIKHDESKSFIDLADKVHRGLRLFNKVFTERAEVLWQSIIRLHAIADDISNFHHKAKIAGITGGTTTAVGGVTAIAGLALAPFTFGASLVITAVGVGVATAGGIASASAAISDNVNNMHDRKKVEIVLQDYETHLLDVQKILHFVNQGLYRLRGHPFLRSGTQHYSEDWEVRSAVQMIGLVDTPVMRAVDVTDSALASVQGLFKGMDKFFIKDSRELKKGCKKEVVGQIKEVATVLNDSIVELNVIREELQDATGNL